MSDESAIMELGECTSPSNDALDQFRFEAVGATFDALDDQEEKNEDLSAASTVDVDNTHPYLLRYADAYAHECTNSTSPKANRTRPTFIGVQPPSGEFKEGQHDVVYTDNNGTKCEAVDMKILYDDKSQPHYTIKLASGVEEHTGSDKLDPKRKSGAKDENGDDPKNCVDFMTNPTTLFRSLYHSEWENAERCLESHPEEASVWVTRYATERNESVSNGEIRWQLLPLHLYICLVGVRNEDAKASGATDDDKNENSTLKLLTDLLSAYPQATQCSDDQNMIPLHSAIRGNSSLAFIDKLLEVDPASVYWKDERGRNAFQLVEKMYEKHIHKHPVGSEDEAIMVRYAGLMELLSDAARRVACLTPSPIRDVVQQKQEKFSDEGIRKHLLYLEEENLALRQENAELHHRAAINSRLLLQLVEKLQMYEEQRSVNIENYNEIFGSKDENDEKRKEILVALSEDDGTEQDVNLVKTSVQVDSAAYQKRLERYRNSTPPSKLDVHRDAGGVVEISKEGGSKEETQSETEEAEKKGQRIFRRAVHLASLPSTDESSQQSNVATLSAEEEDQLCVE